MNGFIATMLAISMMETASTQEKKEPQSEDSKQYHLKLAEEKRQRKMNKRKSAQVGF